MKKLIAFAAIICSVLTAEADTNTPVSVPGAMSTNANFLQSSLAYFTSFDTNSTTFGTNAPFQVFTGVKFQSGINEGAVIGGEAQPIAKIPWLTFRDMATLADTVGTVSENEFDIGAFFTHYDLHFGAFVGVNTLVQKDRWGAIIGIGLDKALTANSFAGVDIERRVDDHDPGALTLVLKAGFTF